MTANSSPQPPIALYLISGFLGSGKTTFLRRVLEGYAGQRLGVIVNEFGEVGIDGSLLQGDDVKMVEINRGSIFCACLKDGFVRTLKAFAEQPIDTLLIENSGMADPSSMNRLLNNLQPYLARPYAYHGCISLVDGLTFLEYVDLFVPVQNQIISSTIVLVNKTDLCDATTLQRVHEKIAELNPQAFIVDTVYADLPLEIFESKLFNNGRDAESSNTMATRPETCLIEDVQHTYSPAQVTAFCEAVRSKVWRIKGFFRTESGFAHLDLASGQIEIHPETERDHQRTQIVVIAQDESMLPLIQEAWRTHCGQEITLRI